MTSIDTSAYEKELADIYAKYAPLVQLKNLVVVARDFLLQYLSKAGVQMSDLQLVAELHLKIMAAQGLSNVKIPLPTNVIQRLEESWISQIVKNVFDTYLPKV